MDLITIVIPVFNEAATIAGNLRTILAHAEQIPDARINLLVVDDGSTDRLCEHLQENFELGDRVHLLSLNHNFGKEAAIHAGLSTTGVSGAVIVMDSDLQHPPALLAEMVSLWRAGHEVVEACKISRGEEALGKRMFASAFYSIFDTCTGLRIRNNSDYKLLDRTVVDFYCALPEKDRFFRGLMNWMNFDAAQVYFEVPHDSEAVSSWSKRRLFTYAISSITSFTSLPLQIVTFFGVLTFLVSLVVGAMAVYDKLSGNAVEGFMTVILLILFIGSILMVSLGLIGIYLARIYDEVKSRPAFIINSRRSVLRKGEL